MKKLALWLVAALLGVSPAPAASPLTTSEQLVGSTITPNGRGGITGAALNAALSSFFPIFTSMGTWDANGNFTPNGLGNISLDASQITTGTFSLARLPQNIPPTLLQAPAPHNEWPDPQLQVSLFSNIDGTPLLVVAQADDFSGPQNTLPIQSYSWDGIYTTGLCTFTQGQTSVTCTGTAFSTNLKAGDWIKAVQPIAGTTYYHWYPVASVQNDTQLTLGFNFVEVTQSGSSYVATGYYSRHRRQVCASSNNTGNLKNGDLITINTPVDAKFQVTPLVVFNVVTNTSFCFRPEYTVGIPDNSSMSVATTFQIARQGVRQAGNLSQISNRVFRLGDSTHSPLATLETSPAFTSMFHGALRTLWVQKSIAGPEYVYFEPSVGTFGLYQGQWRSSGAAIVIPANANGVTQAGSGASASSFIYDGLSFSYGPSVTAADGARRWSGVTKQIASNATDVKMGIQLQGPVGTQFLLAEFFEAPGFGYTQDGVFSTPPGQILTTARGILLDYGTATTGPATVDASNLFGVEQNIQQATQGRLGPGITEMWAHMEAQTNATGNCAILSYRNNLTDPITYGPFLFQQVPQAATNPPTPGNYMGMEGWVPVSNGWIDWQTGCADVITEFKSVDTHKYELFSNSMSTSIP